MDIEISMHLERRGKGIGGSPFPLAQGVLLAEAAVSAEMQRPAIGRRSRPQGNGLAREVSGLG